MSPYFNLYQDAMHQEYCSLYPSRLSFLLNIKLISPKGVIEAVEQIYKEQKQVDITHTEGFIYQIID